MTADLYLRQGRQKLRQWALDPRVRKGAKVAAYAGSGFLLSAASLGSAAQPFALGLISAVTGWRSVVMALGSTAGYLWFWGAAGAQGVVWSVLGCLTALILGKRRIAEDAPLLIPALAGLWVAATGLGFQLLLGDDTKVSVYLVRVALAAASARLFTLVLQRKDPVLDWIAEGVAVLALAQVAPVSWFCLGYAAAGALGVADAFPAAALAGLALDLARVSRVPMTAVLCAIYLIRLIPGIPSWARRASPGLIYLGVMGLCGVQDLRPLLPFILGGILSVLLPQRPEVNHRRGETGMAQVRLELMAGVLSQTQQLMLEAPEYPIDEEALLARTKERACGNCPNRKSCSAVETVPKELLHKPLMDTSSLPFGCKKPARMILELRRSQEQYRSLRADRDRRREYRQAVVQQYQFLSDYLRKQADQLPRRGERIVQCYKPETGFATSGKEAANGDKCQCFYGTACRFYVLLCDGMGTGIGAAQEGKTAANLLRQMLTSGFPAEHALRSLNSLLALRGRAGAVTVDLAEVRLDNGRAVLYKWGAAPSYLLKEEGTEKIGTAGPPPGMDVAHTRETVDRLSLRRGEALILLSDGVEVEAILHGAGIAPGEPPGELAAKLLEIGAAEAMDDATAVVVRLHPTSLST